MAIQVLYKLKALEERVKQVVIETENQIGKLVVVPYIEAAREKYSDNKKVLDYLDELERKDIDLSCCNNMKMCCGEGICGSCTARFSGHRVKRLCKVQTDPRSIFGGRRFI